MKAPDKTTAAADQDFIENYLYMPSATGSLKGVLQGPDGLLLVRRLLEESAILEYINLARDAAKGEKGTILLAMVFNRHYQISASNKFGTYQAFEKEFISEALRENLIHLVEVITGREIDRVVLQERQLGFRAAASQE